MAGLGRISGPSGTAIFEGRKWVLGGWEFFEGDPESPHQCIGYFTCRQPNFEARKNTELHLTLRPHTGGFRDFDAVITVNDKAERLWRFHAR
jgi:hypothetical protein